MLKSFKIGGLHVPENKLSAGKAIQKLTVPSVVTIPLSQHIGTPSQSMVIKGDVVKVGQLIAKASGFVSANIHSPVSGTVIQVDDIKDGQGFKQKSIVIKTEGDEWLETIDRSDALVSEINASADDVINAITHKGIVGMGGATFPLHIKLIPPPDKRADVLIINGAECEPYLTSDHALMLEKGEEIIIGIKLLMIALDVKKAIVGIENNKPDAISLLTNIAKKHEGIFIQPLKALYPQGGEKQLIEACVKRRVPSGKLPIHIGTVVVNVATAFAVYEAVQKNKPLIDRVVTISGHSVEKPSNFLVRIGSTVATLLEQCDGIKTDYGKIIAGGPMMGKALISLDAVVTKGSSGFLLLPQEEAKREQIQPCIRCSKCVSVCPMGLSPYLLMTLSQKLIFDRAESEHIMNCIECGSCSYTCPSSRPLIDYIRFGKGKVGTIIRQRK